MCQFSSDFRVDHYQNLHFTDVSIDAALSYFSQQEYRNLLMPLTFVFMVKLSEFHYLSITL